MKNKAMYFKNKIDIVLNLDKAMQFIKLFSSRDLFIRPFDKNGNVNNYKNAPNGVTYQFDNKYYEDVEVWAKVCHDQYSAQTGEYLYFRITYVN